MKMQLFLHETIYKLLNSSAKIVSFSEQQVQLSFK